MGVRFLHGVLIRGCRLMVSRLALNQEMEVRSLPPERLDSSIGRAPLWYCGGRGFDSLSRLYALMSKTQKTNKNRKYGRNRAKCERYRQRVGKPRGPGVPGNKRGRNKIIAR